MLVLQSFSLIQPQHLRHLCHCFTILSSKIKGFHTELTAMK